MRLMLPINHRSRGRVRRAGRWKGQWPTICIQVHYPRRVSCHTPISGRCGRPLAWPASTAQSRRFQAQTAWLQPWTSRSALTDFLHDDSLPRARLLTDAGAWPHVEQGWL